MKKERLLYLGIVLFAVFLLVFFYLQKRFIYESNINYINSIKEEINILIQTKKKNTLEIAENLAIDKHLIKIIKNNQYDILYKTRFFAIADEYKNFKHLGIHIVDKNGIQRYVSWSKKSLGKNVLKVRADLAEIIKHPRVTSTISSGLFDITFKGIIPIFDENHKFLAVLEVITHFNSIIKKLEKQDIYSVVVLSEKNSKNIKYGGYGTFVGDYFISSIKQNHIIKQYLTKSTIQDYLNIPFSAYDYITSDDDFFDGYFVVNIPIVLDHKVIAHVIAFVCDTHKLKEKEFQLNIIMIILLVLFMLVAYYAYKEHQANKSLISSLDKKIQDEVEEKLKLIYTDSLTGAYKKTKLEEDRKKYIGYDAVMLNIKNFSKINELYGFKVGDTILKLTTQRIEHLLGKKIYRINADEFVLITEKGQDFIKLIKSYFLEHAIKIDEQNIVIRINFNFSIIKNDGNEVLRKLSIALKESKKLPFKDFVYYEEKPIKDEFLKFNDILYDAIFLHKNAEIVPHFQGIRDNKHNRIIKYEALARLVHNGQVYSPYFFIDIAKNSGFIYEITKIMIDKTFAYLSKKPKNITVSINITEDDLLSDTLKPYLLEKLKEYDIKTEQIVLEILEGITSTGTKNNIHQLQELESIGFKIAIDDFGVEYSNFERISELDVDFIKIDGKYIKNITNPKHYKIVKAITDFAHSMGIEVIAEFVENGEIQEIVEELDIEYSQGYFFSKPQKEML